MELNHPFVLLLMEGNIRDKIAKDKHTWIATYEAKDKHTAVFVAVADEDIYKVHKSIIEKSAKNYYKRFGKIKSSKLYSGGEFIKGTTNN